MALSQQPVDGNLGRGSILLHTLTLFFIRLALPAAAISVNVTVDDTFGNSDGSVIPTYFPANDTWHVGSPSEQCNICAIKPSELDTSQILDRSWHHATYFIDIPIQVRITFRGTAVYVYNVVPNFLPNGAITFVNETFTLDGETVGHFSHIPDDSSSKILYNQLVYANMTLSDSLHTLIMSASGLEPSLIFFDYLLYTTEAERTASAAATATSDTSLSSTPPSSSQQPMGAVAGGVVGGVALLVLVAALLIFRLRHRRGETDPLAECSDYVSTDANNAATAASESHVRHLSVGLLSNAATIAGQVPPASRRLVSLFTDQYPSLQVHR